MAVHNVTFLPGNVKVQVDDSLYPYGRHGLPGSLLDIALTHGVHIEHACGGAGVCGSCHVIIQAGMESLSEIDDAEADRIEAIPGSTLASRLACKAVVNGDVTVTIPPR